MLFKIKRNCYIVEFYACNTQTEQEFYMAPTLGDTTQVTSIITLQVVNQLFI